MMDTLCQMPKSQKIQGDKNNVIAKADVMSNTDTKKLAKPPSVRGAPKGSGVNIRTRNRLIAQSEVKPLQVMMDSLADSWKYAQTIEDPIERMKAQQVAVQVAEKVAPYLHPKLQATTIKGDADNPLSFSVSLPDSLLLMAAVRGKGK